MRASPRGAQAQVSQRVALLVLPPCAGSKVSTRVRHGLGLAPDLASGQWGGRAGGWGGVSYLRPRPLGGLKRSLSGVVGVPWAKGVPLGGSQALKRERTKK